MSDQEPVGKRMLGQLRDHTEPYQPEAWDHFELFRAAKNRGRRIVFYWLGAAALLVIFGTALLTSHITDRARPVQHPLARKEVHAKRSNEAETLLPESSGVADLSKLVREAAMPVKVKKIHSKRQQPDRHSSAIPGQSAAYSPSATSSGQRAAPFNPGLLPSRPFNSPITHFGKLRISLPQQQTPATPQRGRAIRWGVAVSQQSNRAAHTDMELNFGLGGALQVPMSRRIALVTGILGSKQSLNVEGPKRLNAPEGLAQLQRVRYQWVNIEVPLQIQYQLKTFKKLKLTAAGGIALQGSIGQEADYLYKTRRTIATFTETLSGPVLVSSQTVEELSSVTENGKKRAWTVGSPLYFGLGIGYQWQNTAVEIEPYVKYPLGASTAERLQLTTLGIQLRLTNPLGKKP